MAQQIKRSELVSELHEKIMQEHEVNYKGILDTLSRIYLITQRLMQVSEEEKEKAKEVVSKTFRGASLRQTMLAAYNNSVKEMLLMKNKGAVLKSLNETNARINELKERFAEISDKEVEELQRTEELNKIFDGPLKSYIQLSDRIINAESEIVKGIISRKEAGIIKRAVVGHEINVKKRSIKTLEGYMERDKNLTDQIIEGCRSIIDSIKEVYGALADMQKNIATIKTLLNQPEPPHQRIMALIGTIYKNIESYEQNLGRLYKELKTVSKKAEEIKSKIEESEKTPELEEKYSAKIIEFVGRLNLPNSL